MISSQINLCDLAGSEKYDKSYKYNKYHLYLSIYKDYFLIQKHQ